MTLALEIRRLAGNIAPASARARDEIEARRSAFGGVDLATLLTQWADRVAQLEADRRTLDAIRGCLSHGPMPAPAPVPIPMPPPPPPPAWPRPSRTFRLVMPVDGGGRA